MPKNRIEKLLTLPVVDSQDDAATIATEPEPEPASTLPTWIELALQANHILCKLAEPCPVCQTPMIPVSWTGERINIVCGNYACSKFRQPSRYLRKSDIQSLIKQINSLEMAEATQMLEPILEPGKGV